MASLIAPLAAGIAGAASGSAEFYERSSATSATVYSDPDGETAVTTHTLDANGGLVRYAEGIVDVVVKNSAGSTVRTFTHIDDARTVRLENSLATGPNSAGSTVAGGRTTLDALLTLFRTSLGTTDGYVSPSGTDQLIKNAIGSSTGVFFNIVTGYGADPTYTNDSTSALQAAINAAEEAGGGIVYAPAGTYKLSSAVTMSSTAKVFFLGAGPAACEFKMSVNAVVGWFTITGETVISGLKISGENSSTTGTAIRVTGSSVIAHLYNCHFTAFNGVFASGTGIGHFVSCNLAHSTGANARFSTITTGHYAGCTISASVSTATFAETTSVFAACTVSTVVSGLFASTYTAFSGGTINYPTGSGTASLGAGGGVSGTLAISGAVITAASGGTLTLSKSTDTSVLLESGCRFGSTDVVLGTCSAGSSSTTRDRRVTTSSVAGTSYTPSAEFGIHEITQSSGASFTFANPSPDGIAPWTMTIVYKNSSGGAITPAFGTNYATPTPASVADGAATAWTFVRLGTASTKWVCAAGVQLNFTP